MWEDILKKDSDLTDEQKKTLEEITKELTEAFKKYDLNALNLMFFPGGTSKYSSKEELMSHMVKRVKTAMKAGLLKKSDKIF
tara:strand:- start:4941 stop:5186 length:246 start_codon:yes stop_codon:yes gene_type:complete